MSGTRKIMIAPSVLAADFLHLEKDIKRAEAAGADMIHCDVMDGVYVPNISFGFSIISKIRKVTTLPLDVHMMTCCPEKYIDVLKDAGACNVTVHSDYSDGDTVMRTVEAVRNAGMKASVSLKPGRAAEDAFRFAGLCDMILVMTVEPGFGGQRFMRDMLPKIRELDGYISSKGYDCAIEVDGGIDLETIGECAEAGASVFVVGTASFGSRNMKKRVGDLRESAERARAGLA